jgi:hypothetical protein
VPNIPVPELWKKFEILRAYSSARTWPLLARAFGRSPKTLQWWARGTATRGPDLLPSDAFVTFERLFAELIPERPAGEELRSLVLGRAAGLEETIRAGASLLFTDLLAREAITGQMALIRKTGTTGLIELEEFGNDENYPSLLLGEFFRLESPLRDGCGHTLALQHVGHHWAAFTPAIDRPRGRVLIPGVFENGSARFMREVRDPGLHRFVALQSDRRFPPCIDEHIQEGAALDRKTLEGLADFYGRLAEKHRACHQIILRIEKPGTP